MKEFVKDFFIEMADALETNHIHSISFQLSKLNLEQKNEVLSLLRNLTDQQKEL